MEKILVTGGLGFIGTNFVRMKKPEALYIVCDAMTYAAHPFLLENQLPNVKVEKLDIRDQAMVQRVMRKYKPDTIFHFAAESHVCRSIAGPKDFMTTNVMGTWNLLEEWRFLHACHPDKKFIHVSTDEVFGSLGVHDLPFTEKSPINPSSPYASSKAASDLVAISYHHTYGLPVIVTNCSNNYGPFQHREKLIPSTIVRLLRGQPAMLYGDGQQVRDWIYAPDHCQALWDVYNKGQVGERYCIGGSTELKNIEVVEEIWRTMRSIGLGPERLEILHDPMARPTDDRRYAIDPYKIECLGIKIESHFAQNILKTVSWYADCIENNRR